MALQCGTNNFNGTASGYGWGFTRWAAMAYAMKDAEASARATVAFIRQNNPDCPRECPHIDVVEKSPTNTQAHQTKM